jgi:hypothetical protein
VLTVIDVPTGVRLLPGLETRVALADIYIAKACREKCA